VTSRPLKAKPAGELQVHGSGNLVRWLLEHQLFDEDQGVTLTARWGEQLDVRHITEAGDEGELSAERVTGYVAKYATKASEAVGVTLYHRVGEVELERLEVPAHVAELVRACWELGARPSLVGLRLRKWAHMLGFGGHFSSKSRRYSTIPGGAAAGPGLLCPPPPGRHPAVGCLGSPGGRPGRDRGCFLGLPRVGLSETRGGVAGGFSGRSCP
jgi:hypothetical protein